MSTISASTTSTTAFKITTDTTGALVFQTGASPTTAMTLGSDQSVTFAGTPTYSGGTANGVAYLNGSKVLTTGTALVFDGTNLGVGVTPSASTSNYRTLQIGSSGNSYSIFGQRVAGSSEMFVGWNAYGGSNTTSYGSGFYYRNTGDLASLYTQNGLHAWFTAASGTAGNPITFTQAMTLDASGNLGVGTTSAGTRLEVVGTGATLSGTAKLVARFVQDTTTYRGVVLGYDSSGQIGIIYPESAGAASSLAFWTYSGSAWGERARINSNGNWTFPFGWLSSFSDGVTPCLALGTSNTGFMFIGNAPKRIIPRDQSNTGADNQIDLGDAGSRMKTIYAATGTINTSDAREKTVVTPLTADELTAAAQIAASVGTYQWLQAVEEKGVAARHHAGLTVQRAIEIMETHNLNPFDYGFICYDSWAEEVDGEGVVTKPAGDRYSFRMDELSLFIARGQQAILEQLTARIETLEAK